MSCVPLNRLQQYLPFTVCAEGCEAAEEQSDDEVRTSQVPEQSEGKTKMIRKQYLPFTVLKRNTELANICVSCALQQCLPFTVLKLMAFAIIHVGITTKLQQYLPFTVLKLYTIFCTVITYPVGCNSSYRLRY